MTAIPTMHVLGLDVSLRSTGWAALSYEDGALIDCGVITSKATDAYAETLLDISTDVTAIARRYPHADIAIEEGICYRSGTTTRRLAGQGILDSAGPVADSDCMVIEATPETDEAIRRHWGDNLASTMRTQGITPKRLVGELHDIGVDASAQSISQWCKGDNAPSPSKMIALARVLRVPPRMLFPLDVILLASEAAA